MDCPKCGRPLESSHSTHRCGYVIVAEAGSIAMTGQSVSTVVEGQPSAPEGRRVDSRPASGGTSFSSTDEKGDFEVRLSGVLDKGRPNERHALKILVDALRATGRNASLTSEGQDERGDDGVVLLDGARRGVQVVSMPVDPAVWERLSSTGHLEAAGTIDDAVGMIRRALEHKRHRAKGTILVLDAAHFGAPIGPSLVRAYLARYGDPGREFSLAEAWLVGPTSRSAFRLG